MPDEFWLVFGILGLMLFVSAVVSGKKKPPEEKLRYPALKKGVTFFYHECGNITWWVPKEKKPRLIRIYTEKAYDNRGLQKLAREHVSKTPLNTTVRITNYARDLVDDLVLAGLLEPNWEPMAAFHFVNGIVMVRYMETPKEKEEHKGAHKDLYFAASDGHLIHWQDKKPS